MLFVGVFVAAYVCRHYSKKQRQKHKDSKLPTLWERAANGNIDFENNHWDMFDALRSGSGLGQENPDEKQEAIFFLHKVAEEEEFFFIPKLIPFELPLKKETYDITQDKYAEPVSK